MHLGVVLGGLLTSGAADHRPAESAPGIRGVALGLFASDPGYNYGPLLKEIADTGATDVLVVVPWYQADAQAHEMGPLPGRSPARSTVARTLRQARSMKLRVGLMPLLRLERRTADEWRGLIAPVAGPETWFAHYRRFIFEMAKLAEANGAVRLGVGTEFNSMERYEAHWRALIADLRPRFSGALFYSANWDHFEQVPFLDALDEVALNAYFPLTQASDGPGDEQVPEARLLAAWQDPLKRIAALSARLKRPVFISEAGWPAHSLGARTPWDEGASEVVTPDLQARLYRVFCAAFTGGGAPPVVGVYFWNWFGHGGASDPGFTPRNRAASGVMSRCLARPAWGPAPAGLPPRGAESEPR